MVSRRVSANVHQMTRLHHAAGPGVPPYRQIADDLRRLVLAGRWTTGEQLPSRRELATQYQVTPNTINRAIAELMSEGLIGANDRQGTFVATRTVPAEESSVVTAALRPSPRVAIVVALDDTPGAGPDTWTVAVLEQFERALSAGGALAVPYPVYWGRAAAGDPAQAIRQAQLDAIDAVAVIDIYNRPGWDEAAAAIDWRQLPAVYVTGVGMTTPFPQLCYDQRHAGYLAARHLADMGYSRIAFLHPCSAPWIEQRIAGARQGARHGGITDEAFVVHPPEAPRDYQAFRASDDRDATMATLLAAAVGGRWDGSTGIIFHADQDAFGALAQLGTLSRIPGRDVGIIGFDDAAGGRQFGLSTIRPPLEQLGERAADSILRALANGAEATQTCVSPVLIQRASTRRR